MATESSPTEIHYLTSPEAVMPHIMLMRRLGESHFGVFDRTLVESALARPRHAATFEGADLIRQAATLCFGLIKNHPWLGGNKRTAIICSQALQDGAPATEADTAAGAQQ